MGERGRLIITLILISILPIAIAPGNSETPTSVVDSIILEANGNLMSWETSNFSQRGFKIVWSKNENPTYPTRSGDKYQYYSDPETNSATLNAFSGDGTYYVRICEYLGGACGEYSNQVTVQLTKETKENPKPTTTCYETDEGKDFYTKGVLERGTPEQDEIRLVDNCENSEGNNTLIEYFCDNDKEKNITYECPYGCDEGACLKLNPTKETGPIDIPKEEVTSCNGCILNETCYPLGYRKEGQFCSDTLEFTNQSQKDSTCENNFECQSNVCVSGECISQGFLKKIISWFKAIF